MKYFLRKFNENKLEKNGDDSEISDFVEFEIDKKNVFKQKKDNFFDKTQIHYCKHEEGLPCEVKDVK